MAQSPYTRRVDAVVRLGRSLLQEVSDENSDALALAPGPVGDIGVTSSPVKDDDGSKGKGLIAIILIAVLAGLVGLAVVVCCYKCWTLKWGQDKGVDDGVEGVDDGVVRDDARPTDGAAVAPAKDDIAAEGAPDDGTRVDGARHAPSGPGAGQ